MKKLTLLFLAIFVAVSAYSAYLKNVPIELKQPDGSVIRCFVTGDEFHQRVHDKDNYTIIQDTQTGYYVYAQKKGEELVTTQFVVGKSDPKQLALEPNLDISVQQIEEKRTILKSGQVASENPTKGNFNNLVISVRFSDQNPTTLTFQDYEITFNSAFGRSLKSYFKEVSNSQLNITSNFFPAPINQTMPEYQDSHPRGYYCIFDQTNNPIGYKTLGDISDRRTLLFKNAIQFVSSQISETIDNYDLNNDGVVDNVTFVVQGNTEPWNNLLWPSQGSLSSAKLSIGTKQINIYNLQLSSWFSADVLCHEFFHALGAPDLYRYNNKLVEPTGSWDIMGNTNVQHMTTYMKWKYGKWFDSLPEISQPGTYTLRPVSKSPYACYKIRSPLSPTEYFILEYRKKEGLFENALPSDYNDGLIIYRINTLLRGNSEGPPDELYVYRPDGTTTVNGDISKAAFTANTYGVYINNNSNPSCFLSNGERGWIDISSITGTADQISFTVNAVNPPYKPQNFRGSIQADQFVLKWSSPLKKGTTFLGYNVFLEGSNSPINSKLIADTTYITPIPGQQITYTYKLTANYLQGGSDPVSCVIKNSTHPEVMDSLALVALYNKCNGPNWTKKNNWLTGPLKTWQGVWLLNGRVNQLALGSVILQYSIGLEGLLPAELSNLTEISNMDLSNNLLSGPLPEDWNKLRKIGYLNLNGNKFTGGLPDNWSTLVNLYILRISDNQLAGKIPASWSNLVNLVILGLDNNKLTKLPDLSKLTKLNNLWIKNNLFDFGDIEPNIGISKKEFTYSPQGKFGKAEIYNKNPGDALTLTAAVGGTSNIYQWYKNSNLLEGKNMNTLVFESLVNTDSGIYVCKVSNPKVSDLTIESESYEIKIFPTNTPSSLNSPLLNIYPNPTSGIITLEIAQNTGDKTIVSISNLIGVEIFRKEIVDAAKFKIDLSSHIQGVYLIKISNGKQQYTRKLIISKV